MASTVRVRSQRNVAPKAEKNDWLRALIKTVGFLIMVLTVIMVNENGDHCLRSNFDWPGLWPELSRPPKPTDRPQPWPIKI